MAKTDLRIIKTLKQIDLALLSSLKVCPFHKITVDMLCKSALINRSTFYKYYLDKYDLLDKFLKKTLDEFRENINVEFINADPSDIHDGIYIKNYESALTFISGKKEVYQILWSTSLDQPVFNEMTRIVHDNILAAMKPVSDRSPQQEKYADLYAHLFASNMMSLVLWWFKYYDSVSMKDVEEIMTDNMHLGLFKTFKIRMRAAEAQKGTSRS
ncbi:TetR/AcrR family transcriptional regulator [Mediterraneibacter glycyrrhizinilyticus]|nr:TetR/AcrR family transcriptional regulator [Mediterraneibacter glycyrrhizinilyticus]MBM6852862.1 TetR/AcrR family transcriptional regulator [Mediterraneibacter glycyrrhizinilyticus]